MKKEIIADLKDMVICDICNKDWTSDETSGGLIVGSYAVCPDCEPEKIKQLKKYDEMQHITATCPEELSFAEFIVYIRGPERGKIVMITADDDDSFEDILEGI